MEANAKRIASRIVSAWNLPPGMRPGEESPPDPQWYGASATEVYEAADPERLDEAMREAIAEDAYEELTAEQVEELATGDYYTPVSAELDWDSATLHFERNKKPTDIAGAPELFSTLLDDPFVD